MEQKKNRYGGNVKRRLDKLNQIYEIIKSNDTDYNKAAKLLTYYSNEKEFEKSVYIFIQNGQDDENLNNYREALNNYKLICNTFKKYKEEKIFSAIISLKKNRSEKLEKIEEELITTKDIEKIMEIIYSDLEEEKKALKLYEICNEKILNKNLELYNTLNLNEKEKLNEIKKIYKKYDEKKLFDKVKNQYKCTIEEVELRLKKLNLVYEIITSNENEYYKAEKLLNLFQSSEEFKKIYCLIYKYGKDKFEFAKEALNNYEMLYQKFREYEDKKIIKSVNYILSIQDYLQNYEYAKFIVEKYIKTDDSYKEKIFLDNYGIDKEIFEFCIETIKELDEELYKKYLERKLMNNRIRSAYNTKMIHILAESIKKGKLPDGKKMDLFEFVKRLPIKRRERTMYLLTGFMKKNNEEDMTIIIDYMKENGLCKSTSFNQLSLKNIYETKHTISKIKITNEDNDIIIDYLKINDIPIIYKTYALARKKYLEGEITKEIVEQLKEKYKAKEKVIIIPSKKKL